MRANLPLALVCVALVSCQTVPEPTAVTRSDQSSVEIGDDLRITGPHTHLNLTIYLVHGANRLPGTMSIIGLESAMSSGETTVYETGDVNQLVVENVSPNSYVFVQSGDIVQGGKQDRVLAIDQLLPPGSGRVSLAAYCVERGRWQVRPGSVPTTAAAQPVDPAPDSRNRFAKGMQAIAKLFEQIGSVSSGRYSGGYSSSLGSFSRSSSVLSSVDLKRAVRLHKQQTAVWRGVSHFQSSLASRLGSGGVFSSSSRTSLALTLGGRTVQDATREYTSHLDGIATSADDVLGFVFAINGRLNCADIYGSNELFRQLWPKLLAGSAIEAVAALKKGREFVSVTDSDVRKFLYPMSDAVEVSEKSGLDLELRTSTRPDSILFETRHSARPGTWYHRSYLARVPQ